MPDTALFDWLLAVDGPEERLRALTQGQTAPMLPGAEVRRRGDLRRRRRRVLTSVIAVSTAACAVLIAMTAPGPGSTYVTPGHGSKSVVSRPATQGAGHQMPSPAENATTHPTTAEPTTSETPTPSP